jgi:inorganic pyrophosphatase
MEDDKGPDAKIICVPANDYRWNDVQGIENVPANMRAEIDHFFSVYKMLEPDKYSNTRGFESAFAAWEEIKAARRRAVEH